MSETDLIVDQIERAYGGDPWHGASIASILEGVDSARAGSRPIAQAHSIWELVLHLTGWAREVARRLGGSDPGYPLEGDFPPVIDLSPAAWAAARVGLEQAHRELVATVRRLPADALDHPVGRATPGAPPVSNRQMLHGLVQHDAYHAGQIAILKKAAI